MGREKEAGDIARPKRRPALLLVIEYRKLFVNDMLNNNFRLFSLSTVKFE